MALVLIIVGIVVLLAIVVWFVYNRTVARRNAVDNSWAQIETALQRRHDLIPNLVEAVKGYATHEQSTFEEVTKARTTAVSAKAPGGQRYVAIGGVVGAVVVDGEAFANDQAGVPGEAKGYVGVGDSQASSLGPRWQGKRDREQRDNDQERATHR